MVQARTARRRTARRILVAEASAFSRGLIRSGLDMAGYRVVEAANLEEAIRGPGAAAGGRGGGGRSIFRRTAVPRWWPRCGSGRSGRRFRCWRWRTAEQARTSAAEPRFQDCQMKFDRGSACSNRVAAPRRRRCASSSPRERRRDDDRAIVVESEVRTGASQRQFATFFVADLFFGSRCSARAGGAALPADDARAAGAGGDRRPDQPARPDRHRHRHAAAAGPAAAAPADRRR